MPKYESGDIAKFYFVVMEDDDSTRNRIIGWTDNKDIAKAYLEFHKCNRMRIKEMHDTIDEIGKVLEENYNDEIKLANLLIRDASHKKGKEEVRYIMVPVTDTELRFISEEEQSFLATRVRYSFLNGAIPYMKKKYKKILDKIFLGDVIMKAINNVDSKFTRKVYFDQVMLLYKSFPDMFGI